MLTPSAIFKVWAPSTSIWSPWVAPVIFTQLVCSEEEPVAVEVGSSEFSWLGECAGAETAVVVDLPGMRSVEVAMELARRGHRPVPLYNAAPGPVVAFGLSITSPGIPTAAIEMAGLLDAVCRATRWLASAQIADAAPPVFMLDSDRILGNNPVIVGVFDNRWLVFPQDFPSANFLKSHGIQNILLIQAGRLQPHEDLAHVLLRWQEAGIAVHAKDLSNESPTSLIVVARPSRFRRAWYRALAILGLRRSSAGGFGSVIPHSSAG